MKEITYNDGLQSRSRSSMLILNVQGTLVKFQGVDIPGVCVVMNESYNKNGKWSSTTYQLALNDNIQYYKITESWDLGLYIPENNWQDAYKNFKEKSEFDISFESFEIFCRAEWKNTPQRLDKTEVNLETLQAPELTRALAEKEKIKQELAAKIAKEKARLALIEKQKQEIKEAKELEEKVSKLKEKMGKKISLAEMQELYKNL